MSARLAEDYVQDILCSIEEISSFVRGMDYAAFASDKKTVYAVIRSIEIAGEASKRIPEKIRARHPKIPWKRMAGMRDKLTHAYFGVDSDTLWIVATKELPELRPHFETLAAELPKQQKS